MPSVLLRAVLDMTFIKFYPKKLTIANQTTQYTLQFPMIHLTVS